MADAKEYPKRPSFFAYKLTRMMFKTALANEIGPEACHLIIQIAHTEDAGRYSKAVTFYNEQLLPVCGFTNVKSLDRARAKAVKSGWLVYIAGGKSKAGKYWTQIPEQYIFLDDTQIDESNSSTELQATTQDATCLPVAGKETGDKREVNGRQEPEKREINARETPEKRATIIPVPNPYPIPDPKEIPPNPQGGIAGAEKVAEKTKRVSPDSEQVKSIYNAYPRKVAPDAAFKAIAKVLGIIEYSELLRIVKIYAEARRQPGQEFGLTPHPATWFNRGSWKEDPGEWKRLDNEPRGRGGGGGGEFMGGLNEFLNGRK